MKCESNRIGSFLDECFAPPQVHDNSTEWAYYSGACDALKIAGFNVEWIPCGRGAVHIVTPPDKIIIPPVNDPQMKLEV